jgi:hypothetical protein
VALLLQRFSRFGGLSTSRLLLVSHTLIVLLFLLASPLLHASDPMYDDVYGPYLFVPGVHIYHPASVLFGRTVFPWLLGRVDA